MDRNAMDLTVEALTEEMMKTPDKTSKEYVALTTSLRNVQDALMKDLTYEQNRIAKNMDRDLKEQEIQSNKELKLKELEIKEKEAEARAKEAEAKAKELENTLNLKLKELEVEAELRNKEYESRVRQERIRSVLGFIGVCVTGTVSILGVVLDCRSRERRVDKVRNIKDVDGILDRDVFAVAK